MSHKKECDCATIKTVIVDDEEHCINDILSMLSQERRIAVVDYDTDPGKALTKIVNLKPDLLLLDIQMQKLSGFELLNSLHEVGIEPYVIFITAYDKFAIEAIRNSAFDFLLKPVNIDELSFALERLYIKYHEKKLAKYIDLLSQITQHKKIKFNTLGGFSLIDQNDIVYIQADWNYSEIHLDKDKYELITSSIGTIEKTLENYSFIRISRSVIINLSYLKRIKRATRTCILEKDGLEYKFKISLPRMRFVEHAI